MAPSASKLSAGGLLWCCTLNVGRAEKKCPGKGVQYNVPRGELPQGWTVHYEQPYSHATTLANVRPGTGACILLGAQKVGAPNFDIVATGDRVAVESQSMVWINDAFWYTADGWSVGFAAMSNVDVSDESPGDTGTFSCFSRVSWLLGRGDGGYRAGCDTTEEKTLAEWKKVVMFGPEVQTCVASICGLGLVIKSMDLPAYCSGIDCTETECCENAGKCKKSDCSGRYVLKKEEDVPLFCAGNVCSQPECCVVAPKCDSNVCGPLYHLRTIMTGLPTQCSSAICSQDECCKINPPCASSDCNVGFVLKPTGQPSSCAAEVCTSEECCTDAGTCSLSVCIGEYEYKPFAQRPTYCAGVTCTLQECCGGWLPPTVSVVSAHLLDLDLDDGEIGGNITWSLPSPDRVTSYHVYLGNSKFSQQKVGETALGTNMLSLPADTEIRRFLYVFTANQGGLQATPHPFPLNDTSLLPSGFTFTDLDLDEAEIGGYLRWSHGLGTVAGLLEGYNIYVSPTNTGAGRSLLGQVYLESSFNPEETVEYSLGPDAQFMSNLLIYPFSTLAERTRPANLAIDDNQAYVFNLDFLADSGALSGADAKGTVTWRAPANTRFVTAYRVYFTDGEFGNYRQQVGDDVRVGKNEVNMPDGFAKANFTHVQVCTVSEFTEQTNGRSYKFSYGSMAGGIAAGSLGLGAAGRMASAASGANTASNAADGMKMDKMERCAAKTSNLTAKAVTAIGTFINKDRQKFDIKGCGGQYLRSFFNSMLPCCVHHHHQRIVLKGPDSKRVLHRLHLCDNSWDDDEVLIKKISNSYYSVVGLTPEPFLLKRKVPQSRIFSPLGISGIMAKGLAPILALIVIAIVTCGLDDWFTGAILGGAGVVAVLVVLCAKPGGAISQCMNGIKNAPPARIRDQFWSFIGLLVGVMPATPAFMSGTAVGYLTGILATFCALLSFLGRDVFSMVVQFFGGAGLTCYCFVYAVTSEEEEAKVDIILFVSAALVIVSGMDTYVKNTAAKFQDIDLPEDEIVIAAEQSAKDIGVSICNAIALEAFISGHMEARLQGRLVDALEGLAKEAVSLSKAVLNFLVEEVQDQGVERIRRCFEKRVPRLIEAYAPLSIRDAGIISGAAGDHSPWEEFEASFGKLVMDAFTERFIKDVKKSLSKVRQSAGFLQSRLDSIKRLAGLDARAAHRISQVVIGHRADCVREMAEGLKRRVPADGDLIEMVKFQEKNQLMKEDFRRINELLDGMLAAAGEDETYKHKIDMEKLEKAQTNAHRGARNLENIGKLLQPGTLPTTENVKTVSQSLGTLADVARAVSGIKPKLTKASTVRFDEAILGEAREELPQLEQVKNEDDRADIVSAYCTARSTAAIVSVVTDEVYAILERCDAAIEQLNEARTSGLRILGDIRAARKAQTLHLLAVRDEVVCWLARYPMKVWTRLKVLHYTADNRYSEMLEGELERIISRDARYSIARQFSCLEADNTDKGNGQSKWAAKIFGVRSSKVHPDGRGSVAASAYRASTAPGHSVAGRMTTVNQGDSFRATMMARQSAKAP